MHPLGLKRRARKRLLLYQKEKKIQRKNQGI